MITEDDLFRGRTASMKRTGKFAQGRKTIHALRDFKPGMEVEDEDVPISTLILAFLCFIGMVTTILLVGKFVMWMTV